MLAIRVSYHFPPLTWVSHWTWRRLSFLTNEVVITQLPGQDGYKLCGDYTAEFSMESAPTVFLIPYTTKKQTEPIPLWFTDLERRIWSRQGNSNCWEPVAGLGCGRKCCNHNQGSHGGGGRGPSMCLMPFRRPEPWPGLARSSGSTLQLHIKGFKDRKEILLGFLFGVTIINWRNKQWENETLWYFISLNQNAILFFYILGDLG